jgi:Sigma 54 modulation protein / S30EA ribosomal protein
MEAVIEPVSTTGVRNEEAEAARPGLPAAPLVNAWPAVRCQIAFEGLPASEAVRGEVRAWLDRLGALTASMLTGNVLIESVDEAKKEQRYRATLELTMPRGVVVVGREHPNNVPHDDVYVAVRNAFRAARRQLELLAVT